MKKRIVLLILFLTAGFLIPPLTGATVDTSIIPADTKWIIHFDLDTFNKTYLRELLLEKNRKREFQRERDNIYKETRIDLFKDVSDITLFGSGHKKSMVVCCRGNLNRSYILKRFKNEVEHLIIKHATYEIYRWKWKNHGVFVNERIFLFSHNLKALITALDTIKGKEAGLHSGNIILGYLKKVPRNAFIVAAAGDVSTLSKYMGSNASVLKNTGFASFLTAEQAKIITLRAILSVKDSRRAEQIGNIIRGLISLVQLKADHHERVADLLANLKIKVEKNEIFLNFSHPAEKVAKILLGYN